MEMKPRYIEVRGLKKGPNGRNLCRWCKTEVSPPRRTFCSEKCVHEWMLRSNANYLREKTYERDKGVCAMCGLDTDKLLQLLLSMHYQDPESARINAYIHGFGDPFRDLRVSWGQRWKPKSLWQADHIIPVAEGGGQCGLENIRTLCTPCHQKVTSELRTRLRKRKR